MKTIAYLRCSTTSQDLEKNKLDILILANQKKLGQVEFVEEKISGKVNWKKRKIFDVIQSMVSCDNLIVSELSRLGRSMLECMEILAVCTEKHINIFSVKGNWSLDNSIQSKIIAMAFSMAAEIERELMSSRTKEALQSRKLSGMKLGRPRGFGKSILDQHTFEIESLLKNGATKRFIASKYNISEQGLWKWLKKKK
jgi:DNA invertase Pin-like site-specific DNA recombinase